MTQDSDLEALRYLPPVAKTTAAFLVEHSFEYGGINEEFDNSITYKGWAIKPRIYQPIVEDEPEDFAEDSFVVVTWLETEDYWCKQCDEEFDSFDSDEEAIAYVMELIDKAETAHSLSPGQLSLFKDGMHKG